MINARFEHFALNVADMDAVADWYEANLGLKKVRYDAGVKTFLADNTGTVIMELYSNPNAPAFDLPDVNWLTLHVAYVVDDIDAAQEALLKAGATIEDPKRLNMEDWMVMLRDPFGLPLQLLKRAKSLLEE